MRKQLEVCLSLSLDVNKDVLDGDLITTPRAILKEEWRDKKPLVTSVNLRTCLGRYPVGEIATQYPSSPLALVMDLGVWFWHIATQNKYHISWPPLKWGMAIWHSGQWDASSSVICDFQTAFYFMVSAIAAFLTWYDLGPWRLCAEGSGAESLEPEFLGRSWGLHITFNHLNLPFFYVNEG